MQIRLGRVRDHAAALDAAALAREALDAATTREGHSADVWNRIVAFVESLDTALRARTAQELRRLHPKHRADEHARP